MWETVATPRLLEPQVVPIIGGAQHVQALCLSRQRQDGLALWPVGKAALVCCVGGAQESTRMAVHRRRRGAPPLLPPPPF